MQQAKAHCRSLLRQRLAALSPEQIRAKSIAACALLSGTAEFARARVIMLYLPTPTEVDTAPLALKAWQADKTVAVPTVSWEQRRMLPVEITSLTTGLTETRPGIREPLGGKPVPLESLDLVVVPALGFSRTGHRIGRGMGFYDRFLSQTGFVGVTCGLAFDEQLVQELPTLDHDMPVGMLVTDREILRFAAYSVRPA